MKARKRPLVVDAEPVERLLYLAAHDIASLPSWVHAADEDGRVIFGRRGVLLIATPDGHVAARRGDYLIHGTQGEIYKCEGATFTIIYEPLLA